MRALLLTLICIYTLSACDRTVGRLIVRVVRSSEATEEPLLLESASVRLRVDGPHGRVGPVEFSTQGNQGVLPEVPVGENQIITVEGLDPEGIEVSRGQSSPLEIVAGNNEISLFVGRLEAFSHVPSRTITGGTKLGMEHARAFHTATQLGDGSILLVGGTRSAWRPGSESPPQPLKSVEILEANSLTFRAIDCDAANQPCPLVERFDHTVTSLSSGNLLITGGVIFSNDSPSFLTSAEIYDPSAQQFFPTKSLTVGRGGHGTASIDGERVLVFGGSTITEVSTKNAELFQQSEFTAAPDYALDSPRSRFASVTTRSGDIVVVGGLDAEGNVTASTSILRKGATTWKAGPSLKIARTYHQLVSLDQNHILVVGGLLASGEPTNRIELLDIASNTATELSSRLKQPRFLHGAVGLDDDRILILGGFTSFAGSPSRLVDVLTLHDNDIAVRSGPLLTEARAAMSVTHTHGRNVVVAGGIGQNGSPLSSAEVFVY